MTAKCHKYKLYERFPIYTNKGCPKNLAIGSLLILIILFFTVNDDSDWIYNGGFYLISLVTLFEDK
jgi:hypothetical protein